MFRGLRNESENRISEKIINRKLPVSSAPVQADLLMMPTAIGTPGERPSTAYILLLVDEKSFYIMAHEMISPLPSLRDMELSIPTRLLSAFKKAGVKPSIMKVLQDGKLSDILHQLGLKNLPFKVAEEKVLDSFFLPMRPTTSKRVIMDSIEFTNTEAVFPTTCKEQYDASSVAITDLGLTLKQKFYYIFDWGDERWFELTYQGMKDIDIDDPPEVIARRGESPPQYPD